MSRRDGINYVFNGQHTIEIVAQVSESRDTPVWCMIYDDLDYKEEADIFANQMKYVKPLLPYETFMANIEAGSDKQLIIQDLVESYGLTITSGKAPGGICAVATLENIYDKYGFHVLDRVLRLVIGTWEGEPNSLSANMLNGIARVVFAYGDQIKDNLFKERLGRISVKALSQQARDRRVGSLGYAEAILIAYNKRSKKHLRWDKLYSKKSPRRTKDGELVAQEDDNGDVMDDTMLLDTPEEEDFITEDYDPDDLDEEENDEEEDAEEESEDPAEQDKM